MTGAADGSWACAFCAQTVVREGDDPLALGITYASRDADEPPDDTIWAHLRCLRAALHPEALEVFDLMGVPKPDAGV